MSKLRHSTTTLTVLAVPALLAAVAALVTAPADAQEDTPPPPVEFFIFTNVMTNPDDNNDGTPDRRWQVQVTAGAQGNCIPRSGGLSYTSSWINAGEQVGASFSTRECVFRIAAKVRLASGSGCMFRAQLAWTGDGGNVVGAYRDGSVITSTRPDDETRLAIRRYPDAACAQPKRTYFVLGGESIVKDLPSASADPDLLARARRAAAVGEYTVRVEPAGARVAPGCDIATTFTLHGDRSTAPQELGATGDRCPSRASIVAVPAHVKVLEGKYVEFDAALPNIIVDLTSLVRIESARIAIIQDVVGSTNRGAVSYTITRSCGGTLLESPPAQASSSELYEGRFTVHSPDVPQFGAVGTYPVVANSPTSNSVAGCSVTIAVGAVPAGCTVAGGNSQTLTWTAAKPFANFDFEFDIYCGDSKPPPPTVPPPPGDSTGTSTETSTGDAAGAIDAATADLRIVARKLDSGKIEFGLQQWQHDDTWGERRFPRARLFPVDAEVGRRLVSSPLTVSVGVSADSLAEDYELRIVARRVSDGRVEFGLETRRDGGSWGDRQVPTRRFFPAGARVDRWLGSSVITLDG